MSKRKRAEDEEASVQANVNGTSSSSGKNKKANTDAHPQDTHSDGFVIQIVTGSYEKILHGMTASIIIPQNQKEVEKSPVKFADTFLFSAHTAAIRCIALSPLPKNDMDGRSHKVVLASGGSDERINLYQLSTKSSYSSAESSLPVPSLTRRTLSRNPENRELGSLLHHSSSVNALSFATRSKLLSAADDNTIGITRTRDWTVLSTIKAPNPKVHGRPSGDTAPLGGTPAGVNDFAVHPSMKLMLSVGRGERCMRLWNLMTGKKAGVLDFGREILREVGEGKWGVGEGRKIEWNTGGTEFAIGFERGAVVFGTDCKPRARVLPTPRTKIHQMRYLPLNEGEDEVLTDHGDAVEDILIVSTEDGRIVFFLPTPTPATPSAEGESTSLPNCSMLAQLQSGDGSSSTSRIKDFEALRSPHSTRDILIVAGGSDGLVRIWRVDARELLDLSSLISHKEEASSASTSEIIEPVRTSQKQIGSLLGTYETGNRITCLRAFVMSRGEEVANGSGRTETADLNGVGDDITSSSSSESE
ncbi:MAG: hypothetical protein M1833_007208 [Piccolia ochrophora]|nr:MAG: hypothetical protein M1833_007208 [Piccolia ochrophora]